MPETGFLDYGDYVSWPFIDDQDRWGSSSGQSSELPRTGIADAGFVVGPAGDFDVLENGVYLNTLTLSDSSLQFNFKCDASEFSAVDWVFAFPASAGFGDVARIEASYSGSSEMAYGVAYLTLGNPDELRQWNDGTYDFGSTLFIENGRIRDGKGGTITSINIANDLRMCPASCCNGSSWDPFTVAIPEASNLDGEIIFKEGVNCAIETNGANNTLVFAAEVGLGSRKACDDWIITPSGIVAGLDADCPQNASCDGFIRSINGLEIEGGTLFVDGDAGVVITGSSTIYRVVVAPDSNRMCASSEVWTPP